MRAVPYDVMGLVTRAGLAAAIAAAQVGLAYRFALAYRARAGYPRRFPPTMTPADLGLAFETLSVPSGGVDLPAWFIPASASGPAPGVVLVHGWESARDRTLPLALFLHAAGFHCLTIDIRGHGANPPEAMPLTAGEFGLDALAAFQALVARPDVTSGAILGHSMGAIGALLAGAADSRVAAVVATSAPADPYRLTRQTFRLARLPIPDPIAYPLAWLTTHVYLRPRRHVVADISATAAVARYRGPILLIHGDADDVVPVGHLSRLAAAARRSRAGDADARPGRNLGDRRRPALVAVRGRALSGRGRAVPRGASRGLARTPSRSLAGSGDPVRARPGGRGAAVGGRHHPRWLPDARAGGTPWRDEAHRGRSARDRRRTGARLTMASMSVWDAVSSRRVVRRFAGRPLEDEHLDRILRAGRRANSSKNQQRWAFIVARDRDHLRELAEVGPWAGHVAGAAAAIALVTPDPARSGVPLSVMFDLGMAADSMILTAWELGIGSVPATVYEQALARSLLGYPEDHHCEFLLSFGYPLDPDELTRPLQAGGRRPLEDIVHEERW